MYIQNSIDIDIYIYIHINTHRYSVDIDTYIYICYQTPFSRCVDARAPPMPMYTAPPPSFQPGSEDSNWWAKPQPVAFPADFGEIPPVPKGDATPDAWRAALRSGTAPGAMESSTWGWPIWDQYPIWINMGPYGTSQIGYLCKTLLWFLGCLAGFLAVGPVGPLGLKPDQLAMCPINPARSVLDVLLAMDSFCSIFLFQPRLGPLSETFWNCDDGMDDGWSGSNLWISLDARSCHWRPAHTWRKRSQAEFGRNFWAKFCP